MRDAERCSNGESAPLVQPCCQAQNDKGFDGLIPQLFTSLPALNEAVSCLAQTTTYFTGCFSDYAVEPSTRDSGDSVVHAQELETFSSLQTEDTVISDHPFSSESTSTLAESSSLVNATSANHVGIARATAGDPSENTGVIVHSNHNGQNGISMFQGYRFLNA
ncbi:Alpha/beta-Hydrolases superfamily protein [Gossypium australe]|uniref:Alpha/beta-Hydrolases superfamily protein n=1 Tax=Gossypium australe TaxID=47621 RepID=A0A5B6VQJ5_9ROSI|nr:Alpha/beta-Hydrolases superfamily protein [Gossypium australe]